MIYESRNKEFEKAVPYAIGGGIYGDKTYVKTPTGGILGYTGQFCQITGSKTIGDAAGALAEIVRANKEYKSLTI